MSAFAVEAIPRISRAQAMHALSSQATIAGSTAVIVAAEHATRLFPMLTTAAGKAQMPRFVDANGKGTNDEKAAAKDPKSGKPADNPARNRRCRPRSTPPTSRRARPPS